MFKLKKPKVRVYLWEEGQAIENAETIKIKKKHLGENGIINIPYKKDYKNLNYKIIIE